MTVTSDFGIENKIENKTWTEKETFALKLVLAQKKVLLKNKAQH